MGYKNLSSFYETSKTVATQLGMSTREFNKKFRGTLTILGFEDCNREWYRSYGGGRAMDYIFSGDNVPEKLSRLFDLEDDNFPAHTELEISEILSSIIPDERYRTVESRYKIIPDATPFNPEADPRSEGIKWIVSNYFHHMI